MHSVVGIIKKDLHSISFFLTEILGFYFSVLAAIWAKVSTGSATICSSFYTTDDDVSACTWAYYGYILSKNFSIHTAPKKPLCHHTEAEWLRTRES